MKPKLENTIGFRVTTEVREQIEQIARREDRQPSYIVRRIVMAALTQERSQGQRENAPTHAQP